MEDNDLYTKQNMERRNALGYIFEGIDYSLVERLHPEVFHIQNSEDIETGVWSSEGGRIYLSNSESDKKEFNLHKNSKVEHRIRPPLTRSFSCVDQRDNELLAVHQLSNRRNASAYIFSNIDASEKFKLKRGHLLHTQISIDCI